METDPCATDNIWSPVTKCTFYQLNQEHACVKDSRGYFIDWRRLCWFEVWPMGMTFTPKVIKFLSNSPFRQVSMHSYVHVCAMYVSTHEWFHRKEVQLTWNISPMSLPHLRVKEEFVSIYNLSLWIIDCKFVWMYLCLHACICICINLHVFMILYRYAILLERIYVCLYICM